MKLPRDLSGPELVKALRKLGYEVTRQKGSHIRVTTRQNGEHHEVIPNHNPIKPGTLSGILKNIANHHRMTLEELLISLGL
ncbi:MAG TPA: type II toxin-antitoxin system HicA family toxin [Verrucomicrobiae bacterium]|jgi:predicted RNA binding protein YcfA (HicA-like mRNA interferase family)|nr:type II toxin-antitoxin system HicA family toxin [Verrucomicrobiae bacterium]